MKSAKVVIFALVLAPLGTAAMAHADEKVISGTACSARHPETQDVLVDSGGIESEAATIDVYCPLVRDTTAALQDVEVGFTQLVLSPPFNGDAQCDLIARNIDDSGTDVITVNATGIPTNGGILSFASELPNLTEGTDRMYTVRCTLQDGEVLGGIYWNE